MKRALLNNLEPGRVCAVVDPGNEFEVSSDFQWVDCPDDTTTYHTYKDNTFIPFDILSSNGFAENAYKLARAIEYKSIGDQLDMLFKELQSEGTISNNGPWATHIATVKQNIPKDNPAAVLEWIRNNPPTT